MKKDPFLPILISLLIVSCQSEIDRTMNQAESLLQQSPDSALTLLENLPRKEIKTKGRLARFALLKSAALDKNYIDVTSDSLSSVAIGFYYGRNNKDEMLAWYYHALVQRNALSYTSSIVSLEKAERIAKTLGDYYQLGLIFRNKAKLFNLTNNNPSAIENRKQAIQYFKCADKPTYQAFSELDLAIDYLNNNDYDKADSLLTYIRTTYSQPILHNYCNIHQASILVELDTMPEKAISLFKKTSIKHYSILDYGYLAKAYNSIYQRDSSDSWFAKGYAICKNEADTAALDDLKSQVEAARGNYNTAYRLESHAAFVQDSLTRVLLQQSLSAAQRDYYKSETNLREEKIRTIQQRVSFGAIVSFLLTMILAMMAISWSHKKDQQLKEEMARLAVTRLELERVNKEKAHLVGSLFSEKINRLDQLCEHYFRIDDDKQKEIVFKQVKELSATIRRDESLFISLEKDLDRYCNGIMTKLREQVPRIKGENLKIISLFFAGFSYESIQLILRKNSAQSLRTARSRFRKEIMEVDAPEAEFFIKMLEMKKRPQAGINENMGVC